MADQQQAALLHGVLPGFDLLRLGPHRRLSLRILLGNLQKIFTCAWRQLLRVWKKLCGLPLCIAQRHGKCLGWLVLLGCRRDRQRCEFHIQLVLLGNLGQLAALLVDIGANQATDEGTRCRTGDGWADFCIQNLGQNKAAHHANCKPDIAGIVGAWIIAGKSIRECFLDTSWAIAGGGASRQ